MKNFLHTYLPMKMEQTVCSETPAYQIQMAGNYPEESIQQNVWISDVCHTRCVFKLYGEVNSVKNTTIYG